MKNLLIVLMVLLVAASCQKESSSDSYTPTPYSLVYPSNFPPPFLSSDNVLTSEGIALGRKLYFDPILSSNGLSCSSCHLREKSFSSPVFTLNGVTKSIPPHVNLAWNPEYNWDGSAPVLDHVALGDFEPDFFNTNPDTLFKRLSTHAEYPDMFYKAFGIRDFYDLSYDELKLVIANATAQFMRTMISYNSRYDKFLRHEVNLTMEEAIGYDIFYTEKGDCFHCHGGPLATDNLFHNTGLEEVPAGYDAGRFNVTGNELDRGKFSSPTLRNIALTAPYMHDGRFQTLSDVVEFYNSGVHLNSPNVDPIMTKPGKENGLGLTAFQKACLVKYLETYTDSSFIENPAFSASD